MDPRERLSTVSDGVWAPAVLAGVASMPVTVAAHWLLSTSSVSAVSLVGVVVGYLYRNRSTMGIRVGTRMGLVGSLPALWLDDDLLGTLIAGINEGLTMGSLTETVGILLMFGLVIGSSVFTGLMGTILGIQTARYRPSTEAS